MNIIKRSGIEQEFNLSKIVNAISKANNTSTEDNRLDQEEIEDIAASIERHCKRIHRALSVEEIQDIVEMKLMKSGHFDVARKYITHRYSRQLARHENTTDKQILSLIESNNEEIKQENSNKNPTIASTQRDYMAGEVSKDISKRYLLPNDVIKAHEEGLIHFHDMDYFAQHIFNCCLINLEDMLQNGTVISGTKIDKPHSFITACNIATQIIAQVASGQYGGQSISIEHLAPFVDISRQKIKETLRDEFISNNIEFTEQQLSNIVEDKIKSEIKQGIQTLNYQVCTLQTTNGQAPFITFFMYLNAAKTEQEKKDLAFIIEEIIKQRYIGMKNKNGVYVSPAFPKLIYVLQEDNIKEGAPYFYLTELAAKCTAKRLVPDYISEKIMKQTKIDKLGIGRCFSCMGCRSFLSPYLDENNNPKYWGRFNQGVVTINIPDAALAAGKDLKKFWKILDSRLELCHKALQCRHNRLKGTKSDISPIHWQYGALSRLQPNETIDKLLYNDYSTISLGYVGIWESVEALIGKKLTEPEGEALGIKILQSLNDHCEKWRASEHIGYSVYGTPEESTTYKFAKCLQKRWGIIPGVTDKNYVTNSYHVHVTEQIDAFSKLTLESKFQKLSPGGAISYVEVPNMQNNIPAVIKVIQHIYDTIMYAELNTKSDYCMKCGYDGEMKMIQDKNGKYIWHCPNCGNEDFSQMSVARRVCGYISSSACNQGRMQEIGERVLHL